MRGITYFLGGLATLAVTASAFAGEKIGVVGAANGEVTALRGGKSLTVKPGDAVFLNDVFETGTASEAQLIFLDRSTLSLTPRSKLTVDNYVYNPASKDGQMNVQGMKGVFRFVGGALSKNHPVSIKTPVATIGIRGGIAETNIAENGATDAIFVYGDALTLTNQDGKTITTTDFGTGLQLDTPTGVPGSLPSAVVASRLVDAVTSIGIGSTPATQSLAPSTAVDSNLNFNTDGSAAPAASSGGTSSAPAPAGDEGSSSTAPAEGGAGNADASTSTETTVATTEAAASTAAVDATASVTTDTVAIPASDMTLGTTTIGQIGSISQPLPPVVQVANITSNVAKDSVINTVRTNVDIILGGGTTPPPPSSGPVAGGPNPTTDPQSSDCNTTGTCPPPPPPTINSVPDTHRGRYVMHSWSGAWGQEPGAITGHYDGANFISVANPDLAGDPDQQINLPLPGFDTVSFITTPLAVDDNGSPDYFIGKAYNSFGGAMQYYQLKQSDSGGTPIANGDQVNIVQGIRVSDLDSARRASRLANGALVASDVRFYDFLPDLTTRTVTSPTINDTLGFFDYSNTPTALRAGYTALTHSAPFGLAVDWATGRYIGGVMDFDFNQNQYLKVSFGEVDNNGAATDQFMKGFSTKFVSDGTTATRYNGTNKVGKDIFATDGGPIAGMVVDYNLQSNIPSTVSGSQVAVLNSNPTATATSAVSAPTAKNHKGFAAGIISEGGVAPMRYASTSVNDVTFNTDAQGNVGSTMKLYEGDGPTNAYMVNFGSAAGKSSAYLGKDLYAAEQGSVQYSLGGGAAVTSAVSNGAMVAGKTLSGAPYCSNCQYTSWGVWAGQATGTGNGPGLDVAHMVPYIEGRVTDNSELAQYYDYGFGGARTPAGDAASMPTGPITYSGNAYANVYDGTDIKNATGTVTAAIDLQTRYVNSMNINMSSASTNLQLNTPTPINQSGMATFNASSGISGNVAGVPITNANIRGALFGPKAEEVGGNFDANAAGGKQLGGVYHGTR